MRKLIFTLLLLLLSFTSAEARGDHKAPMWYIDSSQLDDMHKVLVKCWDDTTSPRSWSDSMSGHTKNSGIRSIEVAYWKSNVDSTLFATTVFSTGNYGIQDTTVLQIVMLDTTASGFFSIDIIDSVHNTIEMAFTFRYSDQGPIILPGNQLSVETITPEDKQIQIYPNPVVHSHSVRIDTEKDEPVEIYDTQGHTVATGATNTMLDVSSLATGHYFARVGKLLKAFIITR